MSINSYSQSLKPIGKHGELYCFDLEQLRVIAILTVEETENKKVIIHQEALILNYKQLSASNDSIIAKQELLIANQQDLIANHKVILDEQGNVSNLEIKALKTKHLKQKKMVVVVLAILVGLLIIK